jgi:LPS export ABC transporter protein LptC
MLKIRSFQSLLLAFLALAVVAMLTFFMQTQELPPKPLLQNSPILEEAMKGVHAKRYDKQGKLIQVVDMHAWLHYKDETITQMFVPQLVVHQDNGSRLIIAATQGEGFHQMGAPIEKLRLIKDVSVKQINPKTNNEWELKTSSLLFYPKQQTAQTSDKVTVFAPGVTMHADGIEADLKSQTVKFLSNVKSFYATPEA